LFGCNLRVCSWGFTTKTISFFLTCLVFTNCWRTGTRPFLKTEEWDCLPNICILQENSVKWIFPFTCAKNWTDISDHSSNTVVDSLLTLKWRFSAQSELGWHGTNLWKMEIQSDLGNPVTFTLRTPEHSIYRFNLESTFVRNGVTWIFQ